MTRKLTAVEIARLHGAVLTPPVQVAVHRADDDLELAPWVVERQQILDTGADALGLIVGNDDD